MRVKLLLLIIMGVLGLVALGVGVVGASHKEKDDATRLRYPPSVWGLLLAGALVLFGLSYSMFDRGGFYLGLAWVLLCFGAVAIVGAGRCTLFRPSFNEDGLTIRTMLTRRRWYRWKDLSEVKPMPGGGNLETWEVLNTQGRTVLRIGHTVVGKKAFFKLALQNGVTVGSA